MSDVPNPRFYENPAAREPTGGETWPDHQSEWFAIEPPDAKRRTARPGARIMVLLFVGAAAAIVVWHTSYGHAARETIASLSSNLSWVAPEQTDRIEQIRRSVEQMATGMAASDEQLSRSIHHLAVDQEQMTREIIRRRAPSQYASAQAAVHGLRRGRHSRRWSSANRTRYARWPSGF
jgi:hypothetical protein